ncbi:MAG: LPS assembly protein LptD [Pseudomonadota bacterium]
MARAASLIRAVWTGLILALCAALPSAAQELGPAPATLIADQIRFDGPSETVTASGAVEVYFDGAILRAGTIRYDGPRDLLTVEGPLTLVDPSGRAVFIADFATLSGDLREGVLRSARLVLDRQLQIAATEIDRSEGRYTQAYQTVASTCVVCEENPTPIWEIRARRIIHDAEDRTLWFEGAQFRALGVPLAYFPRLRLPDPSQSRAPGLLVPSIIGNDLLGTGISVPFFVPLGAHRDLTLAPYATSDTYSGLGLRYRQAFTRGWVELEGQLSFDDLTEDDMRGYVFGSGYFQLPRGFELDLRLEGVSDRGYLATYGITDVDRLQSQALVSRTERDEYIEAGLTEYNSLRDGDDNRTLPNTILDAEWTIRRDLAGGIARLGFSTHSRERDDGTDMVGRDLTRIGARADWRSDWVAPGGLLVAAEAALYADVFAIREDSTFQETQTRLTPLGAVELSWPLARLGTTGVSHLITPTVQLAWSDADGAETPNGDSAIVSFDQANLLALNRFPGGDRIEDGARMAMGLSYVRTDPLGWSLGTTLGRIWHQEDTGQFTDGSGLSGEASDWLWAVNLTLGRDLALINRALFDDALNFTSNEAALRWTGARHDLTSTLTWLAADTAEARPSDTAELFLQGAYDIGSGWQTDAEWQYDFAANDSTRAGFGLSYATECIDVAFSLSRRFTSSATVAPSTEFDLTVALNGFGTARDGRSRDRICR